MPYSNFEYCANLEFQVRARNLKIKQSGINYLCFFYLRMSTDEVGCVGDRKSVYTSNIMDTNKQE